ncbi:metallophosphoesterase family protein [Mycoplasmatota bacterium WC30]
MKKIISIFSLLLVMTLIACSGSSLEIINSETTQLESQTMSDYVGNLDNIYNIGLFVTDDLATSIGINFEMPDDTSGYVEYALLNDNQYIRGKAGKKIREFSDNSAYLFEYILEDLSPNTTYKYRVCNEDNTETSEYHTFTTYNDEADSHTFMFLADPQESAETGYMSYAHAMLSVMEYSEVEYDLVMLPGDVVNETGTRTQWNMFFKYSSVFSYSVPMAVTTGNHEIPLVSTEKVNSMEFDGYMNLPNNGPTYGMFDGLVGDERNPNFDNGKTYSFDFGEAHITVVNTEVYCDGTTECLAFDEDNVQILNDWIRNDINSSDAKWKIVMLHRGPYSLSYDTVAVRVNLAHVLEECGVDLVLSGHDHQYSRAVYQNGLLVDFSRANNYEDGTISLIVNSEDNLHFNNYSSSLGVTYVTSNTAATKFYGGDKSSGIKVNYAFIDEYPVIPIITITEDSIKVVSYAVEKETGISIVPTSVFILEEFEITE